MNDNVDSASPLDIPVRALVWGRKDQLQQAQRGGFLCAMYPNTFGRADLEPLYDQAALDAAIMAEREACAKACEKYGTSLNNEWNQSLGVADNLVETCEECAEAIRSRSNAK